MTSGGDSPGMNAAIRAVVRTCAYYNVECVGIKRGYQGMIEGDFVHMDSRSVSGIINRGGTILKSARSKEFRTAEGRKKAYEQLTRAGIQALILIGGDGTFTGGMIFNKEFDFPLVGIPGTIDNDIYGTDYTIGYDTALNTAVEAIDKIRDTASSHDRLFFVEVMGRDAGFIALNAGLGSGAEAILIPEKDQGMPELIEALQRCKRAGKSSTIVVVAEGDKTGHNVNELASKVEKELTEYETRVTILGHIQRGGSPSCYDRVLAGRMGVKAVEFLLDGMTNLMVSVINNRIDSTALDKAVKGVHQVNEELVRIAKITSI